MGVYLRAKFEVSGIILTGVVDPPLQSEPLKSPTRLGLKQMCYAADFFLHGCYWCYQTLA